MYEIQFWIYRSSPDNYQILWNYGNYLLDTDKSVLSQSFVNRLSKFFFGKRITFNRLIIFLISGDHAIDFEIKFERLSAVVKNKSILTSFSNYNSLQEFPSSLYKIEVLAAKSKRKEMKSQSLDKLILGHLIINWIRNKCEALKFIIGHNIDVFFMLETKLEDSFPTAQFLNRGFSAPCRFDGNSKGGGLLLYIREDIPSTILM